MMKHFIDWLTAKISPKKASPNPGGTGAHLRQTGSHLRPAGGPTLRPTPRTKQAVPKRQPEYVDLEPHITGRIEDAGPGKNVLIRNKFVREEILDESMLDTEEEEGIDPYNSGQFDRSRNWDKRGK
jgi:hypothetical protein